MIYADYNGSSPLDTQVKNYLLKRLEDGPFANPNAIHNLGTKTLMGMEKARSICAKILGAKKHQIFFNSGSTEGIATVFHSILSEAKKNNKTSFIISGFEHAAIPNTASYYQKEGFEGKILPTTKSGIIDIEILKKWLEEGKEQLALVSIMAANNESGIIQPYKEIGLICREYNIPFFCDTTQYIGKAPFNFEESEMDYAILSGHKIGALTGAGILLAKNPSLLKPLIIGGGQETGLRGGTQNYIGNETIAVALTSVEEKLAHSKEIESARNAFEKDIKDAFPEVVIIGESSPRLGTTTYLSYPGIHGQAVQIELEADNIFVTTSSACSDNSPVTSHVLRAMGVSDDVGRGVVRISLGLDSPASYYKEIGEKLKKAYKKLSKVNSF